MVYRILAVDDDLDIRRLIALMLESENAADAPRYEVVPVGNGTDALHRLETEDFHLVILDIMMPGMDGWDVCRAVKTHSRTRNIPVMFLSVRNQPLDRVIGVEVLHADAFLPKPFERHELLDKVTQLLRSAPRPTSN